MSECSIDQLLDLHGSHRTSLDFVYFRAETLKFLVVNGLRKSLNIYQKHKRENYNAPSKNFHTRSYPNSPFSATEFLALKLMLRANSNPADLLKITLCLYSFCKNIFVLLKKDFS